MPNDLSSDAFRITDTHYGRTGDIYQCDECGFRQCSDLDDVLSLYVEMDDDAYDTARRARALQLGRILALDKSCPPTGRVLDVGAASGILVEEALERGYQAEGVEPSRSLQGRAVARGLPIKQGVLPHSGISGPYDIVTVIDVIEHVSDPVGLARHVVDILAPGGICLISTPDVRSVAARLMGWRWWHYRVAHIGYFDKRTLTRLAAAAGFEIVGMHRPGWRLPAGYLAARAVLYLPRWLRPSIPKLLDRIIVPFNLFDSLLMVCRKRRTIDG